MVRPTLIENLADHKRELGANMSLHNEDLELIAEYVGLEATPSLRKSMQALADEIVQPMSDAIYGVSKEIAQTDCLIAVAVEKAKDGSPRHMAEYNKMSTHKVRLLRQLDELAELEEERGRSWEPIFDTESVEYRLFVAATDVYLSRDTEARNDFKELSQAEQDRFLKLMAEGA